MKHYSIPMLVTSVVTAVLWLTGVTTQFWSLMLCGGVMYFIAINEEAYWEAYRGYEEKRDLREPIHEKKTTFWFFWWWW